jgi:poly(3-hydroxybutyrate) depolymerase
VARTSGQSALLYRRGPESGSSAKIFERLTRRYDKPAFDLATTAVDGKIVPIIERVAWERPFCKLLHFEKQFDASDSEPRQRLLIVAPLSGHHATLLRGTGAIPCVCAYGTLVLAWMIGRF